MRYNHNYIYCLLIVALSALVYSCADDTFGDNDVYKRPGNTIRFDVSSGLGGFSSDSRANDVYDDDEEGLAPEVFTEGGDTLYLHRYVSPEYERATGSAAAKLSRSTPVNNVTDFKSVNGTSGFLVYASFTSDGREYFPLSKAVLMGNNTEDIWHVSNPVRYWPDDKELRFHALAPASAQNLLRNLNVSGAEIKFDYTVPVSGTSPRRDAEGQPDLMMATTECSHPKSPHSDLAPLTFRHALSAIKFAIRDVADGEIEDISIKGVAGSGSCTFDKESGFSWDNLGEKVTYTQVFNYATQDRFVDLNTPITAVDIDMPEKTFMLIPQEIPEDAELEIAFKRTSGETKILKGKLKTSDIPLWEAGKEYVYTISTSSENWTYVFQVIGSNQFYSEDSPDTTIVDDPTKVEVNCTITNGAYYKVKSYRYRTNRPAIKELLKWEGVPTDGTTIVSPEVQAYASLIDSIVLEPDLWLKEKTLSGAGSFDTVRYNVVFKPQYVCTDWPGDWELRSNAERGSKSSPIDLSKVNGKRTTANCYVINSGGWYTFPAIYGNAIVDDLPNERAYKPSLDASKVFENHKALTQFVKHDDLPITQPEIIGGNDALLVWEDAYGIVDNVFFDSAKQMIVFHVRRDLLQQANNVIALRDASGTILWSWHIWVSEYWADSSLKLTKDVVNCEAWDEERGTFDVAPRNLGWCDPKNVCYLAREGTMTFTQEKSGKTHTLNLLQRGRVFQYWIGNNAYYQFGRKDPLVGFINTSNKVKFNFGEMHYLKEPQGKTIGQSIQKPNVLFVGIGAWDLQWPYDWLPDGVNYYNLWNNTPGTPLSYDEKGDVVYDKTYDNSGNVITSGTALINDEFGYSAIKTVYDPSPAGYVIPPIYFFKLFTYGKASILYEVKMQDKSGFNGEMTFVRRQISNGKHPRDVYEFKGRTRRDGTGTAEVIFNATGHRWYTDSWEGPGSNFNSHFVYLWTNAIAYYRTSRMGLSFSLGNDTEDPNDFIFTTSLQGRRSMARPVRCVKEFM